MKWLKHFMRLVRYDLVNSIRCNRIMYVFVFAMSMLASIYIRGEVYHHQILYSGGEQIKNITFSEDLLFLLKGVRSVNQGGMEKVSEIPIVYCGMSLVVSFITGNYIFRNNSVQCVSRTRSRRQWIASKMICNILNIGIVYTIVVLAALIVGEKETSISEFVGRKFIMYDYCSINTSSIVFLLFIFAGVPLLTAIAIAQLQVAVSLHFNAVCGFLSAMIIYILSIFAGSVWMVGNGCMLQRTEYFMYGGFQVEKIIVVDIILIFLATGVSIAAARKQDIME